MLNQLRDEIHQNAVEHGWWEEERSYAEIIALCHSELSEALEEYRNNMPMAYYYGQDGILRQQVIKTDIENANGRKPEGIAIELADCIIRILDYCGYKGIDIQEALDWRKAGNDTYTLPELVTQCHFLISMAFSHTPTQDLYFAECINLIQFWCKENGIDLNEMIRIKHEYNKNRPFRHGGKKI